MPTSQNGWSANDRSVIASYSVPGGKVALRMGDVSVILIWCLNQWHTTVEPLEWPGIWGYAERLVRGSSTDLSNHASGTAVDVNAPQHPLGTQPTANFTTKEILAIHAIVNFCEGVVRWGGDYVGRKDGMHLEINRGAAEVKRIADKIRGVGGETGVTLTPDQAAKLDRIFLEVSQFLPNRRGDGWQGKDTTLGYAANSDAFGARNETFLRGTVLPLLQQIAANTGKDNVDEGAIAAAVVSSIQPLIMAAVQEALGKDNEDVAQNIISRLGAKLAS